jgi:formate hydrogenlyase transcriptional activator
MQDDMSGRDVAGLSSAESERSGDVQRDTLYPERRAFDSMLASITTRCMNAPIDKLDGVISDCLKETVVFFGGDRALLWEIAENASRATNTHYHVEAGGEPPARLQLQETLPYIFKSINSLQNLCVSSLDDLPSSAHVDRRYLEQAGVRSFIIIPLLVGGARLGALSLASIRTGRSWSNAVLFQFQRIGMVLAGALDRQMSHRLIDQRIRFETIVADLSAIILKSPSSEIDNEIERGCARVAEFFKADRCGLLSVRPDEQYATVTHAWYGEGIGKISGDINLAVLFPYGYEMLFVRRTHLRTIRLDDMPPEAATDRQSYTAMGVRSSLDVPVVYDGRVSNVIAVQSLGEEREWMEEYVPRLRLIGELFVNALNRRRAEEDLGHAYEEIKSLKDRLEAENVYLREEISQSHDGGEIIGRSDQIKYVLYRIGQVASMESTVLIFGETGTGKGLVARAVHRGSSRRDRPMIHVNCAVLPANLIESELFGREKGAFTGAQAKQIGRFELADKGTIFLDEIAELPVELQAKLLRVVETGEFERLGDPRTVKVDVRIIASTNRSLEEEIRSGRFREDLFYRLNVFPITVPPLRQRSEDIPLIVEALIERMNKKMGKRISAVPKQVIQELQNHAWPGNVRELENVIERAVIMSKGPELYLAGRIGFSTPPAPAKQASPETASLELSDMERVHIKKTLETFKWKIEGPGGAAHALGMKPSTLRDKMQKLDIRRPGSS